MRTNVRSIYRSLLRPLLLSAVAFSAFSVDPATRAQSLFIGDGGDNSVKQFEANGTYVGPFVASGAAAAGLHGPRGMIFTDGQLIVVNQNVNTPYPGEILRFDGATGRFVGKLVASSDRNAPFAPRGIVRGGPDNGYYVADLGLNHGQCANQGDVKEYDAAGAFLGNLDRHAFTAEFHPLGVVFGPDGLLYVSASGCLDPTDPHFNPLTGYILRFDASTKKFVDVFASNNSVADLHRPEGLVFDNAGNLWVASSRANANDSDKIVELDGKTGTRITEIPLSTPPGPRAHEVALVFGPHSNLYIPITFGDPMNSTTVGQVWRCSTAITPVHCDIIVKAYSAGGPLEQPWYPVFRNSDPATLKYNED
ncbi:hypothetical protein [Burkholderia sp. Bp8963]|uniref:hypothetical protein n=1 Tax=Burkholderia sp. Bp8963 TaxID=2184547 RepID=UPI0021AB79D7|nr:hypothetical protein [Burkholderia sp. Bp8963]